MKKKEKKEDLKALFYPNVPFDTLFIPYIYREIYFEGIYTDVLNASNREMTIVDVGSNIGVTVQHFREYAKKVYAIEPSPEHFAALKKNKEFNGWDNVEIFNMAIADKCGKMTLSQNDANRTCNSLVLNYGHGVEVETMDFETFFKKNKIENVDFMKFDVEGAEDMILRSESFRKVAHKIKQIEVEFHFPSWPQLVEYMVSLGYQARRYESSAIVVMFFR